MLALFGAVMGQGVIWYTGQFYAQSFLENTVKIEFIQNREILMWAIGLATPFFLFFGWLSDKIGRKWIMLTGMLLGVIFYRPIFGELLKSADAEEWRKDTNYLSNGLIKQPNIKIDTIFKNGNALQITHRKNLFQYKNGIKFTEIIADTSSLAKDVLSSTSVRMDTKPIYSDIILSTQLKIKFIFLI